MQAAFIRSIIITLGCLWIIVNIFHPVCNKPADKTAPQSEQFRQQAATIQSSYKARLSQVSQKADSLEKELAATRSRLAAASRQSNTRKAVVQTRLSQSLTDTASCDSFRQEVRQYVQSVQQQDSVQQELICQLEQTVSVKDSALAICNESFDSMTELARLSFSEQDRLSMQLNKTEKKLKRQKGFTRMLGGATVLLAGITTLVILK